MRYQPPILESELLDGFNLMYLKLSGLWATINHQRTTGKKNLLIRTNVIGIMMVIAPYLSFQISSYFVITVDLQKATFLILHLLIALQLLIKMLLFWFRMDSICRLYNLAKKDFLAIPEGKRPQVEQIFKKTTKKTKMILLLILSVNANAVALSVLFPVMSVDYIAHRTGSMAAVTGGKMKIFGGWYPVPMDQSPYYEVIYAYEALAALWCGIFITTYVCLFYQLLMCLYAQFTALGFLLSTLEVDSVDNTKGIGDTEMYKELYGIIQSHQKLLRYANELRSVYNPLITMILGMGIFVLIISVFQFLFGGTASPMLLFRFLQYLAYQFCEVCIFCFGSSTIEAASSDLQFAIYSSDWYKADAKFRKSAQMLMVRASKGVTLTAIKMYPVNVETIMAILQFTYSTTTLMSRMVE